MSKCLNDVLEASKERWCRDTQRRSGAKDLVCVQHPVPRRWSCSSRALKTPATQWLTPHPQRPSGTAATERWWCTEAESNEFEDLDANSCSSIELLVGSGTDKFFRICLLICKNVYSCESQLMQKYSVSSKYDVNSRLYYEGVINIKITVTTEWVSRFLWLNFGQFI